MQFMREPPRPGTIHRAAYDGDLSTVQTMLAADPSLREKQYGKYGTPLHTAAGSGHQAIVDFLLRKGARAAAAKEIGDNETILMSASLVYPGQTEGNKLAIVQALVTRGASVRAADRNKMTALHYAASQGSAAIVAFLLSKGAPVNARTNADMTALHYAIGYAPRHAGALKSVEILLKKGADRKAVFQGQTLLEYAARANRPEMEALLRKAGVK